MHSFELNGTPYRLAPIIGLICLVVGHASNAWLDLDLLHSRVYIYIYIYQQCFVTVVTAPGIFTSCTICEESFRGGCVRKETERTAKKEVDR